MLVPAGVQLYGVGSGALSGHSTNPQTQTLQRCAMAHVHRPAFTINVYRRYRACRRGVIFMPQLSCLLRNCFKCTLARWAPVTTCATVTVRAEQQICFIVTFVKVDLVTGPKQGAFA
jgi:hypothetical protein